MTTTKASLGGEGWVGDGLPAAIGGRRTLCGPSSQCFPNQFILQYFRCDGVFAIEVSESFSVCRVNVLSRWLIAPFTSSSGQFCDSSPSPILMALFIHSSEERMSSFLTIQFLRAN